MHHQGIIRATSGHHQGNISPSSVHHQRIIRASSVHHHCIITASSANHQFIIDTDNVHKYVDSSDIITRALNEPYSRVADLPPSILQDTVHRSSTFLARWHQQDNPYFIRFRLVTHLDWQAMLKILRFWFEMNMMFSDSTSLRVWRRNVENYQAWESVRSE